MAFNPITIPVTDFYPSIGVGLIFLLMLPLFLHQTIQVQKQ
jgi:hypothetical protein